jgi:hypothetical protein
MTNNIRRIVITYHQEDKYSHLKPVEVAVDFLIRAINKLYPEILIDWTYGEVDK